jgi:hypothetical protein
MIGSKVSIEQVDTMGIYDGSYKLVIEIKTSSVVMNSLLLIAATEAVSADMKKIIQ